jgi:hypothetical protein
MFDCVVVIQQASEGRMNRHIHIHTSIYLFSKSRTDEGVIKIIHARMRTCTVHTQSSVHTY